MTTRRIAILFEYPTLNGGEHSILSMIQNVPQDAMEFVAIAPLEGRLTEKLKKLGIPQVPLQFRDESGMKLPREQLQHTVQEIVTSTNIDLLHANSLSMGRLIGSLASQLEIPCTSHLRDMMKLSQSAITDLNGNSKLVAVSQATRDFHIAQGLEPNRCSVIYNGIDPEMFLPRTESGDLRKEFGVVDDAFLILNVGQICLRKAQDVLVNAFVEASNAVPNAHLLLAGERYSTKRESIEFEERLDEMIKNAGLEHRFHKFGFRDDIACVMQACDLLVHTAKQEPLGRVLLEAGSIGMPIIATDVGGTKEILEHDYSGILLTPNDPAKLATEIEKLYRNPQKRKQLGTNAQSSIGEKFCLCNQREELFSFWKDLM